MTRPSNTVWASVALLSIIVPVGLLATFRLTGVIKEPPKPETVTVEAVSWNMSRPTDIDTIIDLDEQIEKSYTEGIASVSFNLRIISYSENELDFPSWGGDYLKLRMISSANVSEGFIYSVVVKFSRTDVLAKVDIEEHPSSMELHNLEIGKVRDSGTYIREAYFETTALNQPKDTLLSIFAFWSFSDENNTDHSVTVNLEVTYLNGTAYRKVTVPIVLGVFVG